MKKKLHPALLWVIKQTEGYGLAVMGYMLLSLVFAGAGWMVPQLLERFVNEGAAGRYDWYSMFGYLLFLAFTALPVLVWYRRRLVLGMVFNLEQRLMRQFLRLDCPYYDRKNIGELTKHLAKAVRGTQDLLQALLTPSFLVQVPLAIFAGWYIAQTNVWVVLLLVTFMAVYLLLGIRLGKLIAVQEKEENVLGTTIDNRREEVVKRATFLQQQLATDAFYQSLRQQDEIQLAKNHQLTRLYALFIWLAGKVEFLAGFVMVFFFLPAVVEGELPLGTFFALYLYCNYVVEPAIHWGDVYAQVKSAWAEAEPAMEFLAEEPTILDADEAVALEPLTTEIAFRSVSFAYKGREGEPVLHDVSFTIPQGKMTAIVGKSGGGKSTIAKLLLRQYDPLVGEVFFDKRPLRQATRESLYGRIAYLPQDTPLITGTVRENTDLKGEHIEEEIRQAYRNVKAEFALRKGGLDRSVHELSGGEVQRLALARMLLQGADVVVLDEATSALDGATERGIVQTFEHLRTAKGLTQVVIAHRLSTVQHADQIIVMDGGRVADIGTHEELLERSPVYRDLTKTFARQD